MQSTSSELETGRVSFSDYFQDLEDPRSHINRRYDLLDIVFLTLSAVLSGAAMVPRTSVPA